VGSMGKRKVISMQRRRGAENEERFCKYAGVTGRGFGKIEALHVCV
jgi:hypothetical protein